MSDMNASEETKTRYSNADVVHRIETLSSKLEQLSQSIVTENDVRRIVNSELDGRMKSQQETVDRTISQALQKFTALADAISTDYASHKERQRRIEEGSTATQIAAARIEGALSTLIEQFKATEQRVNKIEDETDQVGAQQRDFEWRMGITLTALYGYNPASADKQVVTESLFERFSKTEKLLLTLAEDMAIIKARNAAIRTWIMRGIKFIPTLAPWAKIALALGGGGGLVLLLEVLSQLSG